MPGINFDTHQLLSDMIGDMVGRRQPVVIELSAKDPEVLGGVAKQLAAAIAKIPGIEPASVNDGVVPAGDALEIHVDPASAALEGVTPAEVEAQVYHYLHGAVVTRYLGAVQEVGVRLWLDPPEQRIYRDQLGQLPIRSPDGHRVSAGDGRPDQLCRRPARDHPRQSRPDRRRHRADRRRQRSRLDHRRGAAGAAPAGAAAAGCLLHDRRRL